MCRHHGKQRIRQRKCEEKEEGEEGLIFFCDDQKVRKQQDNSKSLPPEAVILPTKSRYDMLQTPKFRMFVKQDKKDKKPKKEKKAAKHLGRQPCWQGFSSTTGTKPKPYHQAVSPSGDSP